ncbi:hypothetical protein MKW92_025882 [Papaver armeniacum]|nr:hypothetical protein MKW92_025882 [Papaver armeniacum]
MGDYEHHSTVPKETALQALNTIIQLHFEKTLEKKKEPLIFKRKNFGSFFTQVQSTRLQCRHCWVPIVLLSLAHLIFYVSVAQTLRCINGLKYQRRCHKLTLGLATERLRQIKMICSSNDGLGGEDEIADDFEIHYQEPPETYFGKFKRSWALHFGFLILTYAFMVSSSVVLLCF